MIQVEQSTFDKIAAKEVNWNFSDIEEDGVYDMRLAMENTYLFGVKQVIKHVAKDGMNTWFTGESGGWQERISRLVNGTAKRTVPRLLMKISWI
ncbi:hypothetical protein SFC43_05005 [Bacteroides sp. CR5/BHMF/2]|nr:hypothetical protein [Bacteroides sp. CR5/BHMF/2]